MSHRIHFLIFCAGIFLTLSSGCGQIQWGVPVTSPSTTAQIPAGVRLAQGTFTGLNGQNVTGVASIYGQTGSTQYTARIDSLSGVLETSIQVIVNADGKEVYRGYIKSTKGSSNYSFTLTGSTAQTDLVWETMRLYSTKKAQEYSIALLR